MPSTQHASHRYAEKNTADFPYYVFLKEFAPEHDDLREDYVVPELFAEDLYNITPQVQTDHKLDELAGFL